MRDKFTTAEALAAMIGDGATIALAGSGGGLVEPDVVAEAIERRFLATGHPRDLTLVHALGIGARGGGRGVGRFAHEGMVRRVIGGHWTWSPQMQALAREEKIEAYTLPAGVIMLLMREIGARRPGLFTHVGLKTFADPRHGGGACNDRARAAGSLSEIVTFEGNERLRYKPFKVDIGIIRGSDGDFLGNLSCAREAADIDVLGVAMAAHNCGGKVLAQVQRRIERRSLPARLMTVPGILVDGVTLAPDQPQTHAGPGYDDSLSGQPMTAEVSFEPDHGPSGVRRVIASRAADELSPGNSVNFGFGVPGGIPAILAERGLLDEVWITVEQGMHNGQLLDGDLFGAARWPDAIVNSLEQFDFYSGGGIDVACLGMAEMDAAGNVNVSKLGVDVVGPGGFVDITQNAKKVVFCGTFEAKGVTYEMADGGIRITRAGEIAKLVDRVREITFSGAYARDQGQDVLYVTERAVFRLAEEGIELVEIAKGVDLEQDVLARMQFRPKVPTDLKTMAATHFRG